MSINSNSILSDLVDLFDKKRTLQGLLNTGQGCSAKYMERKGSLRKTNNVTDAGMLQLKPYSAKEIKLISNVCIGKKSSMVFVSKIKKSVGI